MLYRKIDATMIQAIRRSPKTTPSESAAATIVAGIQKTPIASATATAHPAIAAAHTRSRSTTSAKNNVATGAAETSVNSGQECSGS